jgi:hypothetical protein
LAAGEPIAGENTMAIWIDEQDNELHGAPLGDGRDAPIGDGRWILRDGRGCPCDMSTVGFLVEVNRELDGGARAYSLRQHPPRGNQSGEPRLEGWCGSWNNVSTYGCGLARIVRQARNGRLCLARVAPSLAILTELGYPELYEDGNEPIADRLECFTTAQLRDELARRDNSLATKLGVPGR